MSSLTITRGYPGSGKSTWAREWVAENADERVRVNRDDLRWNLYGIYHGLSWEQEKHVTAAQRAAVRALLEAGKDVIVDDTNLRLRYARQWADLARDLDADFHVQDLHLPAVECKARDAARDRVVGADVIDALAQRFPYPWPDVTPTGRTDLVPTPAEYVPPARRVPDCYLVDIDGTIAHIDGRSPYDMTLVHTDLPNVPVLNLVRRLSDHAPIVFMSGRSEDAREATENWLEQHYGGLFYGLHMRASGDNRKDSIVKAELFDEHVRHEWNVLGVFDDRDQVVKMWRSMGLTCFQVAEGAF